MAGDVNSNIFINVDTSSAMAQLRALEKELTALNRALVIGTKTAAQAQAKYAQGLLHNVNATGQWTASMTRMKTATEQFSTALDRSKLSLKDYFRYGVASTKTFGRVFGSEFDTVSKLVEKRVKVLQQQYVQLGRDAQGAMNALKFTPKALNYRDVTTQLMLATQRQQIFNKLLDDGSTKLLNFGKNTQWAGRQLMVGFTVPLMLFGTQAIRVFKEIETETIKFKKVYGDIFTDPGQTDLALKNIRALADEYTKYGLKVSETIKMAAEAAAAGNSGKQLEEIVNQTNKLAVLGGVTQEKALETTIALQNAFKIDSKNLGQTINFLNAVENQTVVALEDLTEAIPRVAPVVQQLGGDVKDLAFFMAAMQEGGISAAQGANALKSGLGSLINPSKKAAQAAADVGVNIKGIVEANQGNLRNIVVGFAQALEPLTELQRTRVIEDVFGKYQFARISALLNNITKDGTQAARVLQLANASVEELAILSERELGTQANSAMNKLVGATERLKAAIAPIGEVFAKTLTPAIEFITRMAEKFNKLPDGIKKGIAVITAVVGGLGPIFLMTFGLLANAIANVMKGFNVLRKGYQSLAYGSSDAALKTQYLTNEELENISITNALYSSHERLSAAYKIESASLGALIAQYQSGASAMRAFSASNPGLFIPGKGVPPLRRAGGGVISGPGTSTSDSIPAYVSDGEYVVNAKAVDKYGVETFDALNARKYSTGGPVIGKDGVPRLFGGAWMNSIRSMMPKTRLGIVQDGFALSGFGGAARATTNALYYPNSPKLKNWRSIPWEDDKDGLIIRDPGTGETYKIAKSKKKEFDDAFAELVSAGGVQKFKDRPSMTAGEYLIHRLHKYQKVKKKPLRPSSIFGQVGSAGKKKNKNAPSEVKSALTKAAMADPSSNAAKVLRSLKSDIDFLEDTPRLTAEEKNTIKKYLTVDVAHIDPKDRFLWSTRTGSRDVGVINRTLAYERKGYPLKGSHIFTAKEAEDFLNYLKVKEMVASNMGTQLPATHKAAMLLLERRIANGFYDKVKIKDTDIGLQYRSYRTDPETRKSSIVDEFAKGGRVRKYANGVFSVPGPKGAGDVVPAMLSPGEAVIPTAQTAKYQPLIKSIIADNVPGYAGSNLDDPWADDTRYTNYRTSRAEANVDRIAEKIAGKIERGKTRGGIVGRMSARAERAIVNAVNAEPVRSTKAVPPAVAQPFMALNNTVAANTAAVQDDTDATRTSARTTQQIANDDKKLNRTRGVRGYMLGYGKVPDVDPETGRRLSYQEKQNYRQNQRMQRGLGPSMALGAVASTAMMYGMAKPDSFAGQNMNLLMGVTALAGILPLLNSPLKMMIASIVGLVGLYKMQSAQIKQALLDGEAQAKAMSMTTAKLESLGKYTNQVSITQVSAAQRAKRTTEITPVNQTFGFNFLGSETGKAFMSEFNKTVKTMGTDVAAKNLANQLGSAVQQGVLTADQAESIATNIARSLNDTVLEANLRGRIIELVGPNGINLSKNPYELNVKLMTDARELEQLSLSQLNKTAGDVNQGLLGIGGKRANLKPGGAIMGNPLQWSETAQLQGIAASGTAASLLKAAKVARVAKYAAAAATGPETLGIGAVASLVIGEAITASLVFAARQLQRGEEKKVIAKVAGQLAGTVAQNLSLSQQGIDAMNAEYNASIQNLEIRRQQAKTAKERANLEEQILDLETKRNDAINKSRVQQAKIITDSANYIDQLTTQEAKNKYADAYKEQLSQKFKDDPFLKARADQLTSSMQAANLDQKGTIQIQALITSDQLSLGQAEALVATLTADKGDLKKEIELIVRTTGTEGLTRFAEIAQYLGKNAQKNLKNIVDANLLRGYTESVNDLYSGLEELIKLPEFVGIKIDTEIDPNDVILLERVGRDANSLKKKFDGKPITLEALQSYKTELNGQGVTNNVLDTAIKNWKLLSSLDPNVRLQAMMTLATLTVSDSISGQITSEQKAAFLKTEKGKSLKDFANSGQGYQADLFAKEFAAYQSSAAGQKVAQTYTADLMNRIFPPAKNDTVNKPISTGDTTGEKQDTSWLSDLLQKLKLFKEASIDATGNFKQLLGQVQKYFGPKLFKDNPMLGALDKQRSAIEKIQTAASKAGITLSSSFLDFLKGLDAEQFEEITKQLFNINKEGEYSLKVFPGVEKVLNRLAPEDRQLEASQTIVGAINEAFKQGTLVDFINSQRESIKQTDDQTIAFQKLTNGVLGFKMSAQLASDFIKNNKDLTADIASGAKIFSEDEIKGVTKSLNEYYSTIAKNNITKILPEKSAIQDQITALNTLTAQGVEYETALNLIQQEGMAAYIALNPKAITEDLKDLVLETQNLLDLVKALENTKFFKERTATIQLKEDFAAIAPLLVDMGLSLSDVNEILSNPNLAKAFIQDLKDGKLDAEQLKKYIDEIPESKTFDLQIKLSTREGQEEEFDKLFSKAMEYYDLLEGKIEDDFEPLLKNAQDAIDKTQEKIDGINKEIQDYQDNIDAKQRKIELEITRPIEILQKESSDLGNDLDLMNRSADEITKRYDEQADALTKVFEINSRIANQQKQQLTLADALSQGDISAAAAAAQEMRASEIEAMKEDQLGVLGAAKDQQIANLRSKGGLTRLQIENRQFAISQQVYELEKKRDAQLLEIRQIEDKIYDIKVGRLKLAQDELDLANKTLKDYQKQRDAAIEAIDRQREVWRDAQLAIGFARIDAGYYNDVIEFSNTLVNLMKDGWLGVGDAILAAVSALALYNAGLTKKPLTFEQAQAQAQGTLTGYLDNFYTQLGNNDQKIVDLELKIAEAMERGEDTTALEAELAALRASTEVLADNMYDVGTALSNVDDATTIAGINAAVSQATSVVKNPYGDIDIEYDGPYWVPGDGEGGAGGDFIQVASKGGIIKPRYLRKGGLTGSLYRSMGGTIPRFLNGGFAKGTDTVPAMLTPGEFVMSRYAVNSHGIDKMRAINSGDSIGDSVYNYSINVNVKSDANPDEIARAVMTHIKQVDSKRLRGANL
jgi:TP901 family phage tail tape measure protein